MYTKLHGNILSTYWVITWTSFCRHTDWWTHGCTDGQTEVGQSYSPLQWNISRGVKKVVSVGHFISIVKALLRNLMAITFLSFKALLEKLTEYTVLLSVPTTLACFGDPEKPYIVLRKLGFTDMCVYGKHIMVKQHMLDFLLSINLHVSFTL